MRLPLNWKGSFAPFWREPFFVRRRGSFMSERENQEPEFVLPTGVESEHDPDSSAIYDSGAAFDKDSGLLLGDAPELEHQLNGKCRCMAGRRKALAALQRRPRRWFIWK